MQIHIVNHGGYCPAGVGLGFQLHASVDYVNLHYSEPLSLEQLSELVYVSKYHLSHEFHRLVGTSVYRYIQKKRLMIARQLLSQGQRPNDVYSSCGFSDYAGFYRAFHNEYGISPREFTSSVRDNMTENTQS